MDRSIRIAGIAEDSVVDGPGLRLTVFAQGCPHGCPDCHNPQSHDVNGGYIIEFDEILWKIYRNPLLDGVTFSGGEPFLQYTAFAAFAREIRELGKELDIVVYTGYVWEDLAAQEKFKELLDVIDILVDGPFIKEQRSYELVHKGSKNQRVIDVRESLRSGGVVEAEFGL